MSTSAKAPGIMPHISSGTTKDFGETEICWTASLAGARISGIRCERYPDRESVILPKRGLLMISRTQWTLFPLQTAQTSSFSTDSESYVRSGEKTLFPRLLTDHVSVTAAESAGSYLSARTASPQMSKKALQRQAADWKAFFDPTVNPTVLRPRARHASGTPAAGQAPRQSKTAARPPVPRHPPGPAPAPRSR